MTQRQDPNGSTSDKTIFFGLAIRKDAIEPTCKFHINPVSDTQFSFLYFFSLSLGDASRIDYSFELLSDLSTMLNSKAINFLTKSGGPEATSDRRSFPRPDSPHPRKLKRKLLLDFEIALVYRVNTTHFLTCTRS